MNRRSRYPTTFVLSVLSLAAQSPERREENPVMLSPFEVQVSADSSYIASEAVTGSRVATRIKDLPYTVNVVTSEFLNDFDFFEIDSGMAYTSSLTGLDTQGNYNLRGYGATFQLRNGFYRLGLIDRVNVDRIEIIKGPNAAIYGQTSPAGLVNIISKRPKTKPEQHLSMTAGSQDFLRAEVNATGPLLQGSLPVYHIFSASATARDYDSDYAHLRQRTISEGLLAKFNERSSLFVEFEYSERDSTAAVTTVPYVAARSGNRLTYTSQLAPQFGNLNQSGPNSEQDRQASTVTATYESKWSETLSARVSTYYYGRNALNFNTSSGDQFDPTTNTLVGKNPTLSVLNEDGGAVQADLLAHYRLAHGALENKTLLTFDWSTNYRYRNELKPLTAVLGNIDLNVLNPNFTVPSRDRWTINTRNDHTRNGVTGVYLRQQTAALNGRLIGFAGVRYDYVKFDLDFGNQYNVGGSSPGSLRTAGTKDNFTDDAWSPNVGANFKVTPQIAVFANYSRSFFPNAQASKLGDPRLPNERAKGFDAGIKAGFLSDRLIFTVSGFSIERNGVKATVVENGTTVDRAAGQQKADGVEFDFTWRVTDDLTVLGGFGYTDARISENGRDVDSVGRRPNGIPLDNGGVALRYRLPGALKALALTAGVKYLGEANPNSLATVAGGNPDLARRNTEVPAFTTYDAGLSYNFRTGHGLAHTFRFSVKNLSDKFYIQPNLNLGDSRAFYFAYSVRH